MFFLVKFRQVVSSKKAILNAFVKPKDLISIDLPHFKLLDLGLAIISIGLMDNIVDGAQPCYQRSLHFDSMLIVGHLRSCSITSPSPIS